MEVLRIPENMTIVCALTSFIRKSKSEDELKGFIKDHPQRNQQVTHDVFPVDKRLLLHSWDIGMLENSIMHQIICYKLTKSHIEPDIAEHISQTILRCHDYIKRHIDCNEASVSLRDVNRVKDIIVFLCNYQNFREKYFNTLKFDDFVYENKSDSMNINHEYLLNATYISLYINYVYRIFDEGSGSCGLTPEHQSEMKHIICSTMGLRDRRLDIREHVQRRIQFETDLILDRAEKLKKLPSDIAVNRIFRQNILMIFLAVFSRTPLFVCGSPGSSKTMAVKILISAFMGQQLGPGKLQYLDGMPKVVKVEYQGTPHSETKELQNIFELAKSKVNINYVPLIFFDEMGLAELSPENPLKILHEYLSQANIKRAIKKGASRD